RPRHPAMLLPRRPRAALAGTGAARAISEGACIARGRLVAARFGKGKADKIERGENRTITPSLIPKSAHGRASRRVGHGPHGSRRAKSAPHHEGPDAASSGNDG